MLDLIQKKLDDVRGSASHFQSNIQQLDQQIQQMRDAITRLQGAEMALMSLMSDLPKAEEAGESNVIPIKATEDEKVSEPNAE